MEHSMSRGRGLMWSSKPAMSCVALRGPSRISASEAAEIVPEFMKVDPWGGGNPPPDLHWYLERF